jgi:hypothetical protein
MISGNDFTDSLLPFVVYAADCLQLLGHLALVLDRAEPLPHLFFRQPQSINASDDSKNHNGRYSTTSIHSACSVQSNSNSSSSIA